MAGRRTDASAMFSVIANMCCLVLLWDRVFTTSCVRAPGWSSACVRRHIPWWYKFEWLACSSPTTAELVFVAVEQRTIGRLIIAEFRSLADL